MSSFSIPRRRTPRFSSPPHRSTSRKTLSVSTIRLTRLRLGHQHRRSRLPQNPLRRRLSRLLRSPNKRSFLSQFEFRQNAPNFVGSVLFFRAPLRTHSSECCNTRVLRCEFSGSGIPSDRSVRFLNATALYHFSVAFFCSSVLLLWCTAPLPGICAQYSALATPYKVPHRWRDRMLSARSKRIPACGNSRGASGGCGSPHFLSPRSPLLLLFLPHSLLCSATTNIFTKFAPIKRAGESCPCCCFSTAGCSTGNGLSAASGDI